MLGEPDREQWERRMMKTRVKTTWTEWAPMLARLLGRWLSGVDCSSAEPEDNHTAYDR